MIQTETEQRKRSKWSIVRAWLRSKMAKKVRDSDLNSGDTNNTCPRLLTPPYPGKYLTLVRR